MKPKTDKAGLQVRQAAKKLEMAFRDIGTVDTQYMTAALEHGENALALRVLAIAEVERVLEVLEGIEGRHQLEQ